MVGLLVDVKVGRVLAPIDDTIEGLNETRPLVSGLTQLEIPEFHFHVDSTMKLQSDGSAFGNGSRVIDDKRFAIQKGLDVFSTHDDPETVPVTHLVEFRNFVGLAWITPFFIFWGIDATGHVPLQGTRDTDLDLVRSLLTVKRSLVGQLVQRQLFW